MKWSRLLGFSLLELSVVISIIALVATFGVSLGRDALKTADRITTQERLATIKYALEAYVKMNGYLPCPADRQLTPSSANFGVESRNTGVSPTTCQTIASSIYSISAGTAYIGGVPTRTLGLPDNYAADAWNGKFTYAVSGAHTSSRASYTANPGALTIKYGDRNATNYNVTSRFTTLSAAAAGTGSVIRLTAGSTSGMVTGNKVVVSGVSNALAANYTATVVDATHFELQGTTFAATTVSAGATVHWGGAAATYVVVSHGADGRGAYPLDGTSIPSFQLCLPTSAVLNSPPPCDWTASPNFYCNDIENCDDGQLSLNGIQFYDTAFNDGTNTTQYFDDYVIWGTNANQMYPITPTPPGCASGCDAWCAACTGASQNSSSGVGGSGLTKPVLCSKEIISTTPCEAYCIWGGVNGGSYVSCP